MTVRLSIFAVWTMLLLSAATAAEGQQPQSGAPLPADQAFADIQARTNGEPLLLTQSQGFRQWDARFGWWAFWNEGSPSKTGEYQGLEPSPFWDLDGLSSDGRQTLNFYGTGTDNETTKTGLTYYRGNFRANVDYERFIHRLDHDPLNNMAPLNPSLPNNPGGNDPLVMKQDLNVGKDYAIRVQELNASFKGYVTDNIKARLDVWGMKKEGTRQVNMTAMCYNRGVTGASIPPDHLGPGGANLGTFTGGRCHVLSQAQQIDWTTTEIKPVIEAYLGDYVTIEYSRPMRGFTANDQTVSRFYDVTGSLTYNPTTSNNTPPDNLPNYAPYPTGVVPNNYTDMDQVKISGVLTDNTRAYAYLMAGRTVNREIDMERWFNNADIRLTNTTIENTSITGYGKIFNEAEREPTVEVVKALEASRAPGTAAYNNTRTRDFEPELDAPINYHNTTAGLKGVWRPYGCGFDKGGLAVVGGYEYGDIERANAIMESDNGAVTVDQSHTITNCFQVGPYYRWSPSLDTFIRYKFQNARQPLIGFKPLNGTYNTLLPEHDHIVEIGFDWFPSDSFIMNVCVGVERADNHSQFADFDEENYPMTFTAWYAVTQRFTLSAGYAVYSNFVAQDIQVGDDNAGTAVSPVTGRWRYGAQAHVVTVGSTYCATDRVRLTGQVEWVRGNNSITESTMVFPGNVTVTDLGSFSQVTNETTRVWFGVDWLISPRIVNYYRYELYNFLDKAPGYQTGTAQGILGGLSALF